MGETISAAQREIDLVESAENFAKKFSKTPSKAL